MRIVIISPIYSLIILFFSFVVQAARQDRVGVCGQRQPRPPDHLAQGWAAAHKGGERKRKNPLWCTNGRRAKEQRPRINVALFWTLIVHVNHPRFFYILLVTQSCVGGFSEFNF